MVSDVEKEFTEQQKKRGRPAKNYVDCHVLIPADAREEIEKLADVFGISQGELIAIAVRSWKQSIIGAK